MKLYKKVFVFIIFVSNIVKSSGKKQCIKNILGECVRPLVPQSKTKNIQNVKTVNGVIASNVVNNVEECGTSGQCVQTFEKQALRSGSDQEDNSTDYYKGFDWEVFCKFQPNGYDCGQKGIRNVFYYDLKLQGCKSAQVGRVCSHNYNKFKTLRDCYDVCRDAGEHQITNLKMPAQVLCRLQPDFGQCDGYYPSWYFDTTLKFCRGFSYSGCGGNANRFATSEICAAACQPFVKYDTDG